MKVFWYVSVMVEREKDQESRMRTWKQWLTEWINEWFIQMRLNPVISFHHSPITITTHSVGSLTSHGLCIPDNLNIILVLCCHTRIPFPQWKCRENDQSARSPSAAAQNLIWLRIIQMRRIWMQVGFQVFTLCFSFITCQRTLFYYHPSHTMLFKCQRCDNFPAPKNGSLLGIWPLSELVDIR